MILAGSTSLAETQAPAKKLLLRIHGNCPSSDAVAAELTPLLDRWDLTQVEEEADEIAVVTDEGTSLQIAVVDDERTVSDTARDCQERARVAAVILALRLEPAVPSEKEEPPAPPEIETEEPLAPEEARHTGSELELGAGVLVEKSLDRPLSLSVGPTVILSYSTGLWLFAFSSGVQSSSHTQAAGLDLNILRFPTQVGIGVSIPHGAWKVVPLVELAVDPFLVTADEVDQPKSPVRLDVGPRFGVRVGRASGAIRPFGLLRASWFPRSYVIEVDPVGEVERTPNWWIGASFGVSTGLRRF